MTNSDVKHLRTFINGGGQFDYLNGYDIKVLHSVLDAHDAMLEALKAVNTAWVEVSEEKFSLWDQVRAAIKKAEGSQR